MAKYSKIMNTICLARELLSPYNEGVTIANGGTMKRNHQQAWVGIWVLCLLLGVGGVAGCGGSTSSGTETGSTGSNGTDDSGDSETGFQLSGTVTTTVIGTNLAKTLSAGTITDVIAVSPGTSDAGCKTADIDSAGLFSLRLGSGRPWFIYFIDRLQQGAEMFKGRLKSDDLDTMVPGSDTGSLDLGSLTIDADAETATAETAHTDILEGLGLDTETADAVGELDDVARRYGNPDVDNNGEIDCGATTESQPYMLDFHVRFNILLNGSNATVTDMLNTFWSSGATTTADYQHTGIYVVYPNTFSSVNTGSVTFADSAVTTDEGGAIPAGTATSAVTNNDFGTTYSFGPNISTSSELPSGTITFTIGSQTLTFADVVTPTLAQLNEPTGRIFPFLKLVTDDSACTANCTLASLDYQWMKKSSSGWVAATVAELTALIDDDGGTFSVRVDNNENTTFTMTIPKTSASGSIAWSAANANLVGVSSATFTDLQTSQLCHFGISYDDKLGLRYFESVQDAAGTCL